MSEAQCPFVIVLAIFWAVLSAGVLLLTPYEGRAARMLAWLSAVSFAVSSLVAAFCFGELAWGEAA